MPLEDKYKNFMIIRVIQDSLTGLDFIIQAIKEVPREELIEFLQHNNIKIENQELSITNIPASVSEADRAAILEISDSLNALLNPRRHQADFIDMNIAALGASTIGDLVAEREEYAKLITPIAAKYSINRAVNRLDDYILVELPEVIAQSKKIKLPICYDESDILKPQLDKIRLKASAIEARRKREAEIAELEAVDASSVGASSAIGVMEPRPKAAVTEQNRLWTSRTKLDKLPPVGGMNL